jgi:hypothetical protein
MKTPQAAVDAYVRGDLNLTDLFVQLGRCLAEEDAGFFASLPKDLIDDLVQVIDGCPDTEEGWSRMRVYAISTRVGLVSREQVENEQREEARLLRRGVELVRAGVSGRSGGGGP